MVCVDIIHQINTVTLMLLWSLDTSKIAKYTNTQKILNVNPGNILFLCYLMTDVFRNTVFTCLTSLDTTNYIKCNTWIFQKLKCYVFIVIYGNIQNYFIIF